MSRPSNGIWALASLAAVMTLFLLPIAQATAAPQSAHVATPNLSVYTTDMVGNPLPGYYTAVSQGGVLLHSGFSPISFMLSPGKYNVPVSDYGGWFFNRWNDSVNGRIHPVTITAASNVSLTALYFTSPTTAPDFAIASVPASIRVAVGASGVSEVFLTSVNGFDSAVSLSATSLSVTGIKASFGSSTPTPGTVGTVTSTMTVTVASHVPLGTYNLTITGVGGKLSNSITLPLTVSQAAPANGITVYADRVPASYWASCFATKCALGTGPGAAMWFVLYNSAGSVVQTGFVNENGYTFTGLNPGATYYVYPSDCDSCHGSTHDVLFSYWGDSNSAARPMAIIAGTSLDAWYICTNGCGGI